MNAASSPATSGPAVGPAAPESLEALFARLQGELLGTLVYLVGNLEDARDALQETFIKCWRRREQLGEIDNLKAWVFHIALNTGRDIRATAWRRRRQTLGDDHDMSSPTARDPHGELEHKEELGRLRSAVHQLRLEEQEVFLLRQNAELTYEEIARTTGVPLGTVKTRMRAALGKLRTVLEGVEV